MPPPASSPTTVLFGGRRPGFVVGCALSTYPMKLDPTAVDRKQDHIELAFQSQVQRTTLDDRFYYEPLISAHPAEGSLPVRHFLGASFTAPIWVSSMTGGTGRAATINKNLARACGEFGMGMGLGSCRQLLHSDDRLPDFAVRPLLGEQPLYANLGVAQLEELIDHGQLHLLPELIQKLDADGLIIHVNPLQEWFQPEGDRFRRTPLQTIETVLEKFDLSVIVKEVGQGMGPESLRALLQMPLAAIDFAASGGTNFSRLEALRDRSVRWRVFEKLINVGHSPEEMVDLTNALVAELGDRVRCRQIIISGGVRDFLDGYYLIQKLQLPTVYGQASAFLRHAMDDYETLRTHISGQLRGLELAYAFLRLKS